MAGLIGNVLEWFDFAVYGYFASDIGRQFFPQSSATAQQLLSFAVFALGFCARPVGSLVLGVVGDGIGRRALLTLSIALMAVAIRRGQPAGPTTDQEVEDFIYDALDLLPGTSDVEVRCEGGRATLTGAVSQKRLKRDAGEIAWAIPGISDVNNTITIAPRRRSRAQSRETEPSPVAGRKPA